MGVKIFVLGRPGSGKSHALRFIFSYMENKNRSWSRRLFRDYEILLGMFKNDAEHKRFRPTEYGGFEVTELSALDEASKEIERIVKIALSSNIDAFIFIELARDNYQVALKQFTGEFLQGAYFLLMEADIETCIHRIHERITHHASGDDCDASVDDHFVSDKVMRNYYYLNNKNYMLTNFKQDYGIEKDAEVIENIGSVDDLNRKVLRFISLILDKER